jgi:hypothetical protein
MTTAKLQQSQGRESKNIILYVVAGLLLVAALVFAIQRFVLADNPPLTEVNTLADAQTQWAAADIDSYRYELAVSCFCITDMTMPVNVEVQNGEVASITYVEDGSAANPELFERYATVDSLLAVLAEYEAQDPVKFDVTFDAATGVPTDVAIDVDEMMADEELWFTVTNFEEL